MKGSERAALRDAHWLLCSSACMYSFLSHTSQASWSTGKSRRTRRVRYPGQVDMFYRREHAGVHALHTHCAHAHVHTPAFWEEIENKAIPRRTMANDDVFQRTV